MPPGLLTLFGCFSRSGAASADQSTEDDAAAYVGEVSQHWRMRVKVGASATSSARCSPTSAPPSSPDMARVRDTLFKVEALVQRFAVMRGEGSSLQSLQQAVTAISAEWQGSFARLHVACNDHAMLLAAASSAPSVSACCSPSSSASTLPLASPRPSSASFTGHNNKTAVANNSGSISGGGSTVGAAGAAAAAAASAAAEALLVPLATPNLAVAAALTADSGCYRWFRNNDVLVPSDYVQYVTAGATAIYSTAVKLSNQSAAVLTFGFACVCDASHPTLQDLWPLYCKLITSSLSAFIGSTVPRHLTFALEMHEAPSIAGAMSAVMKQLREVAAAAGGTQLWFRIALTPPSMAGSALIYDVAGEVSNASFTSSLDKNGGTWSRGRVFRQASRLGRNSGCSGSSAAMDTMLKNRHASLLRATSSPVSNDIVVDRHSVDCSSLLAGGAPSTVVHSVVAMKNTLLQHALHKRQQVMVPDVQKLLNQGGWVAADIFSTLQSRPPAALLLLPLLTCNLRTPPLANSPVNDVLAPSFGAIYCMSSALTDFSPIRQQLHDAVVEIILPHLYAALASNVLSAEFLSMSMDSLMPSKRNFSGDLQLGAGGEPNTCWSEDSNLCTRSGRSVSTSEHGGFFGVGHQSWRGPAGPAITAATAFPAPSTPQQQQPPAARSAAANGGSCGVPPSASRYSAGNNAGAYGASRSSSSSALLRSSTCGSLGPSSITHVLVSGLSDKINAHRIKQSQDWGTDANSLDDLELHRLLGAGGYGYVFQGTWRSMKVAVKLVRCPRTDSEFSGNRSMLKHAHEIAILKSVSHPNIVQAYTFLTDVSVADVMDLCMNDMCPSFRTTPEHMEMAEMDGELCHIEVLELCDLGCLSDALKRKCFNAHVAGAPKATSNDSAYGSTVQIENVVPFNSKAPSSLSPSSPSASSSATLSSATCAGLQQPNLATLLLSLVEIASSLAHLHSLGIVHCDIKPDNILLKSVSNDARNFMVKLSDFGLSRVQDDGCLTFPCNSCGTLAYVAPEALTSKKVDQSIDVYSFGILMYELYTNKRPFATKKKADLSHGVSVLGMRPRFPSGTLPAYVRLARACWDGSPAHRPGFEEVVSELNHMLMQI